MDELINEPCTVAVGDGRYPGTVNVDLDPSSGLKTWRVVVEADLRDFLGIRHGIVLTGSTTRHGLAFPTSARLGDGRWVSVLEGDGPLHESAKTDG